MKDSRRRMIAFIAGKMMGNRQAQTVYDVTLHMSADFSGNVTENGVFLLDLSTKKRIVGNGTPDAFTLLYGMDQFTFSFSESEKKFRGYDAGSQMSFSGSVFGRSITLFDEDEKQHFVYEV